MNYLDLSIEELHKLLKDKKIKPSELTKLALEKAKKLQPIYNPFVTILEESYEIAKELDNTFVDRPLFGIPYVAKDNFSTKGILSTGSSNILYDYIPVFDSDAIRVLNKQNAILIGKTVLDELAMGGTGTNGHTGPSCNPWNKKHLSGGSSGGSAVAVASGIVPFALGSDTGDSVRKPAAYCGIVGFKPTWGRISRYGVFPFACSMDHVAYFTRNVKDSAYLLQVLSGVSKNDPTSSLIPIENYADNLNNNLINTKVGYIKEIINCIKNPEIINNFNEIITKLKKAGAEIIELTMDKKLLKAIYPVYMLLSCAEATSNNANLDGIKFGLRVDGATSDAIMENSRTQGFSRNLKKRFLFGAYCLDSENQEKLFIKAQKIRHLIVSKYNELFNICDCIIAPASGDIAPTFDASPKELNDDCIIAENHLGIANFSGSPSITIPSGFVNKMPIGINLTAKSFNEQQLLNFAYALEEQIGLKNLIAKEEE